MKYAKGEESAPLQQPGGRDETRRESEALGRAGGTPEAAHHVPSFSCDCEKASEGGKEASRRQP